MTDNEKIAEDIVFKACETTGTHMIYVSLTVLRKAFAAALDEAEARGIARQAIREMNEDMTDNKEQ